MSSVNELIVELGKEVARTAEKITSVRPATAGLKDLSKKYIENLNSLRGRNLYFNYVGSGLGQGPYVELVDGSVKMDLINGIGIHILGHSHPVVIEAAIRAAAQDIVMQGNLQPNKEYGALLETLLKAAGRTSRLKHGWIGTCGTIVNENALKITRQKNSPARKILAMKNNFAGRSTMMAEITDNPEYRVGLPAYNEVLYVPFYEVQEGARSIEKAVIELKKHIAENPKNIASFIFELVQGEGGFNTAPPEYFKALFEVCREHRIALWADEIQTFARTGELFAFERLGLGEYIDIVTLAKTIQCGAVLYTDDYNPKPGLIAGTFTASTVSLATGKAVLDYLIDESPGGSSRGDRSEKFLGKDGRIQKIHERFLKMLGVLKDGPCKGMIGECGGIGLMIAMTPFDGSKEKTLKLLQTMFDNGLLAFSCGHGPYKIRFLLPAIMEQEHIDAARRPHRKSLSSRRPHISSYRSKNQAVIPDWTFSLSVKKLSGLSRPPP